MTELTSISLVTLTFNRPVLMQKQLERLTQIKYQPFEVIIIDNHSEKPLTEIVSDYPFARLFRMKENLGVAGRNRGIEEARGDIVITLDDDVSGITDQDIRNLIAIFENPDIGAVCFKVLDEQTEEVVNWCHHRKQEEYSNREFITDEITEGAVAFRRSALMQAGLYPEDFFISHEGPDLALRLMNCGYNVVYEPSIVVRHSHAREGRPDWRRYYYDTRNQIWLVLRNHSACRGARLLAIGLGSMFIYSLRDGYFRYWAKGILDGIKGARSMLKQRTPINKRTRSILNIIDHYRPGVWYMAKRRLLKQKIQI
jgi:GT2 family glycosyltransferase